MPYQKMSPPLPEALGETEQDRFKRFAKALLAVPKSEIPTADEALSKLEAEKHQIDAKITEVRSELKKRKATKE